MAENYEKLSVSQLSQALGKHRATIHRMVQVGCPRNPDKSFNLPRVVEWLLERERDGAMTACTSESSPALERFRAARAGLAEADLEERHGRLMPKADVVKAWCNRVSAVTSGLEALAVRLPPLLVGKKIEEMKTIIREEVIVLRQTYARAGQYCEKEILTDAPE